MKIAACFSREPSAPVATVSAMAEAMRLRDAHRCGSSPAGDRGALGWVETSDRFSAVPLVRRGPGGSLLLVGGVPLDLHGSLNERLDRAVNGDFRRAAEELTSLDGAFAALYWDGNAQKLLVVTDPLGLQPLYWARQDGWLLLASESKAFPASGLVDVEMDPAGWGAFIGFRFPIGDRTQLAGVRRFGPATRMVYDPADGRIETSAYWCWPELKRDLTLDSVDTAYLMETLEAELRGYAQHAHGGTVLLSGGFDSRLTLALLTKAGWRPSALTLAHQDELWGEDGRLASRSARRLGVPVELIRPPRSYYSTRHYLDYLVMNEVATPSLYLFIAQVSAYLGDERPVVWDGTPLGYGLVPAFLPAGGFDVLLEAIEERRDAYVWRVASQTFGRKRADGMYEAVRDLVRDEVAKYPDDEQGVTQFEVMNRMRNRTAPNCLKVYANTAMPFVPGVSRAFWDYAGAIPYSATRDYLMYHAIFRRHHPEAADVPLLSGGGLWCDGEMGLAGRWAMARHALAKSRSAQLARKAYRRCVHGARQYWADSRYLPLVRERFAWDAPEIDAAGVRTLGAEARMPFYWQLWRWVMAGELTTWNSGTFFPDGA